MTSLFTLLLGLSHLAPPSAAARQIYAVYEGSDSIKIGTGGTRIVVKDVDFWTNGAPNRPFKVLGIFTDSRTDIWWDGDAIGSRSIAKKVKENGGSAVIVLTSDSSLKAITNYSRSSGSFNGTYGFNSFSGGMSSSSFGISESINKITTRLMVIRYLSDAEIAELGKAIPASRNGIRNILPEPLAGAPSCGAGNPSCNRARIGPPKRKAKTPSGYCYDVPENYSARGSLDFPSLTTFSPGCHQIPADKLLSGYIE